MNPGFDGTVSIIDTNTNTLEETIVVGLRPNRLGFDPATNYVYVVNQLSDSISVINGATDALLTTIVLTGGSSPTRIRMDPAAGRLYVGNNGLNSISVIDTAVIPPAFPILLADVPAGPGAKEINLNATTDRIYVSNKGDQSVSIIDRTSYAEIDTVPAGTGPFTFGFSNAEDVVYVSNEDLNSFDVTVIGEPLRNRT